MALSKEELQIIDGAFESLPDDVRESISQTSTSEVKDRIGELIVRRRQAGMATALSSVVTVTIRSWPAYKQLATVADGESLFEALNLYKTAIDANDAAGVAVHGTAALLAALKKFT